MARVDIIPYYDRAHQELQAVEVNLGAGLYAVAVSRSYYAMFYAVSGLLASVGISRSKHSAIISAFRQNFIKAGLIETEYGKLIDSGFEARQESDYDLLSVIDKEFAEKRYREAQSFVARLETYLREAGYL